MSRASSRHIQRLEDTIRYARDLLSNLRPHAPVVERGNPNCMCGPCRASRILAAATLRTEAVIAERHLPATAVSHGWVDGKVVAGPSPPLRPIRKETP